MSPFPPREGPAGGGRLPGLQRGDRELHRQDPGASHVKEVHTQNEHNEHLHYFIKQHSVAVISILVLYKEQEMRDGCFPPNCNVISEEPK